MNKNYCSFTGHRNIPYDERQKVYESLRQVILQLIDEGYKVFCCGGALGFDTLAAQVVLELKKEHDILLSLVLPCKNQEKYWSLKDKEIYDSIFKQADMITYTSEEYTNGCMHKRNRKLVDDAAVCIAYYRGASGGTAYTIKYAMGKGVRVIYL